MEQVWAISEEPKAANIVCHLLHSSGEPLPVSRVEYFDIANKKKKKMIFSQVWLIRQAFDVVEDHPENFY